MNESLEVERTREIEADLRSVSRSAQLYGGLSTAFLVAATVLRWLSDDAESSKLAWSLLCLGVLFGFLWVIFVAEAIRAKIELSLQLAKCQVLGHSRI